MVGSKGIRQDWRRGRIMLYLLLSFVCYACFALSHGSCPMCIATNVTKNAIKCCDELKSTWPAPPQGSPFPLFFSCGCWPASSTWHLRLLGSPFPLFCFLWLLASVCSRCCCCFFCVFVALLSLLCCCCYYCFSSYSCSCTFDCSSFSCCAERCGD
jgi:hypothetical protein